MKAKEWVRVLTELQPQSPEFQQKVAELVKECEQILQMRVKGLAERPTWMKPDSARWANAFREAGVKWDAVVHGVTMKCREATGDENATAPFPLFKGMLLWTKMSQVVEDIAASSYLRSDVFEVLRSIAQQLGYRDIPIFKSMFDMGDRLRIDADFKEILEIYFELAELQRKHATETLVMGDLTRLGYLRNRWMLLEKNVKRR